MSDGGHHHVNLGAAAQWVGIVAVLLGQVHQCRSDDREATKTSVQVSAMSLRVDELEKSRMALERIEGQLTGMNQRLDDFKQHVNQRFDDLKKDKRGR